MDAQITGGLDAWNFLSRSLFFDVTLSLGCILVREG
jgi:hypothetical protein